MYLEVEIELKKNSSEEIARMYNKWQDELAIWMDAGEYVRGPKPEEPILESTKTTMYLSTDMIDGPAFDVPGKDNVLELGIAGSSYFVTKTPELMKILEEIYGTFTNL